MNLALRQTTTWMCVAMASFALPAFAQNNPAAAGQGQGLVSIAANDYGAGAQAPANRQAARRNAEQNLLGAPRDYGMGDGQDNTDDAQRQALLDTQRMTVTGGAQGAQPANRKAQRNAPGANNGPLNVAGQAGAPNAADGLLPAGAARNAYADPYAGKRAVYKSPW